MKNIHLHYLRGITPKRVTSSGIHLRSLAPGQHSSEETSQPWRDVSGSVSDFTSMGDEPRTSCTESDVFNPEVPKLGNMYPQGVHFDFSRGTLGYICRGKNRTLWT